MSFWSKFGIGVIVVFASVLTLGAAFVAWQNRAEARRIAENYGEHYVAMLKEYAKKSKRLF